MKLNGAREEDGFASQFFDPGYQCQVIALNMLCKYLTSQMLLFHAQGRPSAFSWYILHLNKQQLWRFGMFYQRTRATDHKR
ncbi:hypothetical protein D3C78_1458140 [compost metagenome]